MSGIQAELSSKDAASLFSRDAVVIIDIFHSEQLTGALPDRLTHHAHILTMNGESYRFKQSMSGKKKQ